MPSPREQPPPSRKGRRQDTMPGGWLWIVILFLLAGVMYFTLGFNSAGVIGYSEFMKLAAPHKEDNGKKVEPGKFSKVVIKGTNRMVGEIRDGEVDALPKAIKDRVRYNKVETNIPPPEQLSGNVTKLLTEYGVPFGSEEETGAWMGPIFMFWLPIL